jgi:hypothetical protein
MNMKTMAVALLLSTSAVVAAEVDGSWSGTVDAPGGTAEVAFQFMAKGAELTGTTTGPDGALIQFKNGKVDGARLRFQWISI